MPDEKFKIFVIDDDAAFLSGLYKSMSKVFEIKVTALFKEAKEKVVQHPFDIVLLDLVKGNDVEGKEGFKILAEIKKEKPHLPVIIMSNHDDYSNIEEAIKKGAEHFFTKSDISYTNWTHKIIDAARKYRQIQNTNSIPSKKGDNISRKISENIEVIIKPSRQENQQEKHKKTTPREYVFIGKAPKILEIKETLSVLGHEPDVTVLLLGETGVGKEVAAQFLHEHGARKDKPFVTVNLKGVSESLWESLLFGHKKGAFTGAYTDLVGTFVEADGGILFLDEIGEINLDLQVKLLRFLQEKKIRPVGGKEKHIDIQIVAATNKNLIEAVQKGTFRSDFFHRLNDFPITIPPLRERKEDIPLLVEFFMKKKELAGDVLSEAVWERLLAYSWPGNIRELDTIIRRLVLRRKISKKTIIDESLLPEVIISENSTPQIARTTINTQVQTNGESGYALEVFKEDLETQMARKELEVIEEALERLKRKGAVVDELGFKNHDQLRYRINSLHKKYEAIINFVENFPVIYKKFKLR